MTTTWAATTAQQRNYYSLLLLRRMLPAIVMLGEGRKETIARRQGKTVEWRFLASFARATTPIVEGVNPGETAMAWTKVTATVEQYGAWGKYTDLLAHQSIDDVVSEAADDFGEQAGQTLHTVCLNALGAGSNVRYADAVAGRGAIAAANVLDAAEIRRARRILAGANAKGYGAARGKGYHALIHPYTMESLMADATIVQIANNTGGIATRGAVNVLDGVVLEYGGFLFRESTDAPMFPIGSIFPPATAPAVVDVYGSLFYGEDWFAETGLAVRPYGTANETTNKLSGVQMMATDVDTATKDDPLGLFATIGWKAWYAATILQQARGLRVEHAIPV